MSSLGFWAMILWLFLFFLKNKQLACFVCLFFNHRGAIQHVNMSHMLLSNNGHVRLASTGCWHNGVGRGGFLQAYLLRISVSTQPVFPGFIAAVAYF